MIGHNTVAPSYGKAVTVLDVLAMETDIAYDMSRACTTVGPHIPS